MGERVLCKHEVIGSIPFASTSSSLRRCVFKKIASRRVPLRKKPARLATLTTKVVTRDSSLSLGAMAVRGNLGRGLGHREEGL